MPNCRFRNLELFRIPDLRGLTIPDFQNSRLHSGIIPEFQNSRFARVNYSRIPEFQIAQPGIIPDFNIWNSGVLEELGLANLEWNSGIIPDSKTWNLENHSKSGILEFWKS